MNDRTAARLAFLHAHGWKEDDITALPGDASFRRYFRLQRATQRAMLMDAPPPQEDVRPFIQVAQHLQQLGLSAPQILAQDVAHGWLLLEDFGDATYTRLLAHGADEVQLYQLALDTLLYLHQHPQASTIKLAAYDEAVLLREASLLFDWYLPLIHGAALPDAWREEYLQLWRELCAPLVPYPATLVLRDFHVDNLMRLERAGVQGCGLLDFQDALLGHPAYDLMSLLEDARRDLAPGLASQLLQHYLAACPELDPDQFLHHYRLLAAQRHAKVAGIFVRLWLRDGKPNYWVHLPRVLRLLQQALSDSALTPLREWLERRFPNYAQIPAIPPCNR